MVLAVNRRVVAQVDANGIGRPPAARILQRDGHRPELAEIHAIQHYLEQAIGIFILLLQGAAPLILILVHPFSGAGAAVGLVIAQDDFIRAAGFQGEAGFDQSVAKQQSEAGQQNGNKEQLFQAGKFAVHEKVSNF
jgi:hypothetical protein